MTDDELFVSPRFKADKLASGMLDDKIDVFEDQVKGWTLQHAFFLTDKSNPSGERNAGFAIPLLCGAYFETIESCYRGRASKQGDSKNFFRGGFLKVFPDLLAKAQGVVKGNPSEEVDKLVAERVASNAREAAAQAAADAEAVRAAEVKARLDQDAWIAQQAQDGADRRTRALLNAITPARPYRSAVTYTPHRN